MAYDTSYDPARSSFETVNAGLVPSSASRLDDWPEEHILGGQHWDTKNTMEVPVAVVAGACVDVRGAQVAVGSS